MTEEKKKQAISLFEEGEDKAKPAQTKKPVSKANATKVKASATKSKAKPASTAKAKTPVASVDEPVTIESVAAKIKAVKKSTAKLKAAIKATKTVPAKSTRAKKTKDQSELLRHALLKHGLIDQEQTQASKLLIPADNPVNQIKLKFAMGEQVKHKFFSFRGVIFDVDAQYSHTDDWYNQIPSNIRPKKDQPFYHLLAEGEDNFFVGYVSQQNLQRDDEEGISLDHPELRKYLIISEKGDIEINPKNSN